MGPNATRPDDIHLLYSGKYVWLPSLPGYPRAGAGRGPISFPGLGRSAGAHPLGRAPSQEPGEGHPHHRTGRWAPSVGSRLLLWDELIPTLRVKVLCASEALPLPPLPAWGPSCTSPSRSALGLLLSYVRTYLEVIASKLEEQVAQVHSRRARWAPRARGLPPGRPREVLPFLRLPSAWHCVPRASLV